MSELETGVLPQDEPVDQEISQTEESEVAAVEATEEAPAEEVESESESRPKRLGGWQRKIVKAEQERDFWREEALRGRTQQDKPKPTEPAADGRPVKPSINTFLGTTEQFDAAIEKYGEDLHAYKEREANTKRQQEQLNEAKASFSQKVLELPESKEIDKAFDALPQELADFVAAECSVPKNGPLVLRELLLDEDAHEDLMSMYAQRDGMGIKSYVRALAVAIRRANPVSADEDPPKPKPPKPPTPTGRNSTKTTRSVYDEDISYKEFVKLREAK